MVVVLRETEEGMKEAKKEGGCAKFEFIIQFEIIRTCFLRLA